MAKTKNKKRPLAEVAAAKKLRDKKKSTNPFEIHINRKKQDVLGQKLKNDRGLPGVARSKALQKRKHTLLQEYNQKDKDNVFMDRRIGEKNSALTPEEKAMARFAAEKIKAHKKNIFTLNDEEVLTHRGQTLEEIEKFDDPRSDDDLSDNEQSAGHLNKKFVGDAHFGGGILSKSDGKPSHKESLAELIAKDKKKKAEQKKLRGETMDLTEELDSKWNDLRPLMTSLRRPNDAETDTKTDDYDISVRQLKFESRGTPSDRLKSEEEIMKEEKERLETLEKDRLARMKGFSDDSAGKTNHKSADDLDDGFAVEDIDEEPLAYGEDGLLRGANRENVEETSDNENVEESGAKNADGDDSGDENLSEAEEPVDSDVSDVEDQSEDSEDDLSDIKVSDASSDEDEAEEEQQEDDQNDREVELAPEPENSASQELLDAEKTQKINEIREDLQRIKEIMEKARKELPYTYSAPESYEELRVLLKPHGPEHQSIILERIIKCNHYSLGQENREKLCKVFDYLLQHLVTIIRVKTPEALARAFQIIDRLCPHLFDLAQVNAANTATCVQTLMKQQHEEFKKNPKKYPGLDTLILFKFISLLFPTSDFRHPVVTPALVFMSQILLRCRVKTKMDIARGLFLTTLMLEYTILSKRLSPAAINFLRGVVFLATIKPVPMIPKVVPPFKRLGDFSNLLVLEERCREFIIEPLGAHMKVNDLCSGAIDDDFKIRALVTAINLTGEFKNLLEEYDAVYSIFQPISNLLMLNSWKMYPKNVRKHARQLSKDLACLAEKKLEYVVQPAKKPKALRLYEPVIEKVYDGKKQRNMSKEKAEREKLKHKLKKEMKGAIREIRRDNSFIAKVHINLQIKNDQERKRKVQEIFGDAAMQQGELNKMKKRK